MSNATVYIFEEAAEKSNHRVNNLPQPTVDVQAKQQMNAKTATPKPVTHVKLKKPNTLIPTSVRPTTINQMQQPQFESKASLRFPAPQDPTPTSIQDVELFIGRYIEDTKKLQKKSWIILYMVIFLWILVNGVCVFLWTKIGELQDELVGHHPGQYQMNSCLPACSTKLDVLLRGTEVVRQRTEGRVPSVFNCRRDQDRIHECSNVNGTKLFCFLPDFS